MVNERKKVGYAAGVFDLFHIGHLNLLRRAKERCDLLIVGVTTDEAASYKGVKPFIPTEERMAIVGSIEHVDAVVPQHDLDKLKAWQSLRYDVIFVGSDWEGSPEWERYERDLNSVGAEVVYLPYTDTTSSTRIRGLIEEFGLKL